MKKFIFLLLFSSLLFAHKINLFVNVDKSKVEIYSYFPDGQACMECNILIKHDNKLILKDKLNKQGKYDFISKYEEIEIIIDASSGHLIKEYIKLNLEENQDLEKHLKKQKKKEYLNILFALILILIFFYLLKSFKRFKNR